MNCTPDWPVDFLDAHHRHWDDGEMLYQAGRLANADHLYGLSAECGLKAVMVALGMPTDKQGSPLGPDRVHINQLWERFATFAQGRAATRYVSLLPGTNPFERWSVGQRYVHQRHFTQQLVQTHREGAQKVRTVVRQAREEGMLP